jgi:hypothetical protein
MTYTKPSYHSLGERKPREASHRCDGHMPQVLKGGRKRRQTVTDVRVPSANRIDTKQACEFRTSHLEEARQGAVSDVITLKYVR